MRYYPQRVVTFYVMVLNMIYGTVLRRMGGLLCQGMANKKSLRVWNVKRERSYWGSNPPDFRRIIKGICLAKGAAYCRTHFKRKIAMKVTAIMEKAKDGYYSCYVEDELPGFGLSGFGDTAESAKADMMKTYEEMKAIMAEDGVEVPELEFVYKYDMQSFFDYFSFLNITKVAELAGINPSLMRQYTSGVTNAGQKQYDKIRVAVKKIGKELSSATF